MNIKIGDSICMSVKALFKKYGTRLTFGHIACSYDDDFHEVNYYMYSDSQTLALCEGEVATVFDISDNSITFENYDGDYFRMTREEVKVAATKYFFSKPY